MPYGLRIEDDSAFIRQATGMNFDNSDNGIEYGLKGEHLFSSFRVGASAVLNDGDQQTRMFHLYVGSKWSNFKLTAEYFDPDSDVNEDEQTRYSFIAQYTPISYLQLRAGIRIKKIFHKNYNKTLMTSSFKVISIFNRS